MTDKLIPEGFRKLDVTDEFVGLIGPLWFKAEGERLRVGLPLEPRHGNPMGWAHGGLLVTVADMVMGAGSGHATGIRWPHPTISLSTEFVRGAKLGQWLEGTARIARRTINFCFCSCDLVCGGEIVLVASGVFKVPDIDKIPEAVRGKVMGKWDDGNCPERSAGSLRHGKVPRCARDDSLAVTSSCAGRSGSGRNP